MYLVPSLSMLLLLGLGSPPASTANIPLTCPTVQPTDCFCTNNCGCDQTACPPGTAKCNAGNCNQTGTTDPVCQSTGCDQTGTTNAICRGGKCIQVNAKSPSCPGHGCNQDGSSDPSCTSACSQVGATGTVVCSQGCDQRGDSQASISCNGGGCCTDLSTYPGSCKGGKFQTSDNCCCDKAKSCGMIASISLGGVSANSRSLEEENWKRRIIVGTARVLRGDSPVEERKLIMNEDERKLAPEDTQDISLHWEWHGTWPPTNRALAEEVGLNCTDCPGAIYSPDATAEEMNSGSDENRLFSFTYESLLGAIKNKTIDISDTTRLNWISAFNATTVMFYGPNNTAFAHATFETIAPYVEDDAEGTSPANPTSASAATAASVSIFFASVGLIVSSL